MFIFKCYEEELCTPVSQFVAVYQRPSAGSAFPVHVTVPAKSCPASAASAIETSFFMAFPFWWRHYSINDGLVDIYLSTKNVPFCVTVPGCASA